MQSVLSQRALLHALLLLALCRYGVPQGWKGGAVDFFPAPPPAPTAEDGTPLPEEEIPPPPPAYLIQEQEESQNAAKQMLYDLRYATDQRAELDSFNGTKPADGQYTTAPQLQRSTFTSPWLDRDKQRVNAGLDLYDDDTKLNEGSATLTMAGNIKEQQLVGYMTRHGLYRRADDKFTEFVAQPTTTGQDGYGLWRVWESHGGCPHELLLADPWGGIAWEAPPGPLRIFECSWVVRPGMYRHEGYFKLSRAPIVLSFRTFSLAAPHEKLDVYDGAQKGARLLGRFTGSSVPGTITSTNAEIRVVLYADLSTGSEEVWSELDGFLAQGKLREAQHAFLFAARRRLTGFYRQPMRRIIRALALRASHREENAWMRRMWFTGSGEIGWQRAYNDSLTSVLQDLTAWEKRTKNEEGKEDIPWDLRLGGRRYPTNILAPEQNPYHPGIAIAPDGSTAPVRVDPVDADEHVQLHRALGFLDEHPSGFSLDFTTSADCYGRGIAPYGTGYGSKYGVFPPLTRSSEPTRNYEYLQFPLHATSCQPMILSGLQHVRDRPFTVADSVMKSAQKDELINCVHPGQCDVQIIARTGAASNCSTACDVFMQCVREQMGNRSNWASTTHRNMYNKSFAAKARDTCLSLPEAPECANVQFPVGTEREPVKPPWPWTRESPKHAICLAFECVTCAVAISVAYVECAQRCSVNLEEPSPECADCSYSFEDSYEEIDMLRDRLLEGYLSGVFGFHLCPLCDLDHPSMFGGPEEAMPPECRRCHYALEDLINNDVFTCLDSDPPQSSLRCLSVDREGYNYEQDFFSILKPGLKLDLTLSGEGEDEDAKGKGGGYNYGA